MVRPENCLCDCCRRWSSAFGDVQYEYLQLLEMHGYISTTPIFKVKKDLDEIVETMKKLRRHLEVNTVPYISKNNPFSTDDVLKANKEACSAWINVIDELLGKHEAALTSPSVISPK